MEQRTEERRLITILFADLSNFTALSSQLDPEDVQEIANTTFEILNKPIIAQGGTIHKYEGDLVIALFGLPTAHEDDPERAIKAGLKMMELIPEVNDKLSKKLKKKTDLGLHIGINSGIVVAGEVGSEDKKEWTVMGDVVNLTSRLKDIAKRSEIIVSEPVFRASRYLFDYEVLPPVSIKGIERPVRIFRPLKIKEKPDPKRGIQGLYSPIVGRDKELQTLKEKIDELQRGKGGAIFILGEPGLGKTRLYEEIKKDFISSPIYLFEGRCSLSDENFSYSTILQILKEIFGIYEDTTASIEQKIISRTKELFPDDYKDLAPYICQLFSVNITEEFKKKIEYLDPQSLKRQIFLAVRRLLFEMAKKQPLILVVEDYHWIDSSSLELFEFIFTNWENEQQLLFIGISRIEKEKECWQVKERLKDKLGEKFFEIILEPLDYESSARLTHNLLNILGIPEDFKDRILKKAEGNPFYLEEIIRALIDTGHLKLDAGVWCLSSDVNDIEIPDTVQTLIISRIDRLEPELKQILQIASVIGRIFYRQILQYVSKVDDLLLTLQLATLEEFEYIKECKTDSDYTLIFRHPLLQEVIYNNILKKKRKELHNRVAECIEQSFSERIDDFCDLLSQQFYFAENWEKALTYSIKSAEKAKRLYLNKQAIELYERAEECAEMINNTVKKIYCIKEKSEILNLIGETKSALDEVGKGIELSRNIMDKKSEADCLIAISDIYANLSRYEDMLDSASKALSIYKTINDKRGEAESLNNIGYAYEHFGEYNKALEYYNKSLKIQEQIDDRDGQAVSLNNIGIVYMNFGEYNKALEFLVKSLNIRDELEDLAGQATSLNNIGTVYDDLGEHIKALEYYKKSLKIQEEINDMDGKGTSLNNIGYLFSIFGDYKKALEYYMESLKIRIEIGDKDGQGTSLWNIGVIYRNMGDYQKALEYFIESLKIREEVNDINGQVDNLCNIGKIYINVAYLQDSELKTRFVSENFLLDVRNQVDLKYALLNKAREYITKSEDIAKKRGLQRLFPIIYLIFSELLLAECNILDNKTEVKKIKLSKALNYVEKSLSLSEELHLEKTKAQAFLIQARIETLLGNLEKAEEKFNVAISILEQKEILTEIARAYYYYGEMLKIFKKNKTKSEIEKANKYLQKAKEIFIKCDAKIWSEKCRRLLEKI